MVRDRSGARTPFSPVHPRGTSARALQSSTDSVRLRRSCRRSRPMRLSRGTSFSPRRVGSPRAGSAWLELARCRAGKFEMNSRPSVRPKALRSQRSSRNHRRWEAPPPRMGEGSHGPWNHYATLVQTKTTNQSVRLSGDNGATMSARTNPKLTTPENPGQDTSGSLLLQRNQLSLHRLTVRACARQPTKAMNHTWNPKHQRTSNRNYLTTAHFPPHMEDRITAVRPFKSMDGRAHG